MFAAVFLLIAGYALLHNAHVRVDVLYTRMNPRQQAWVNMLGAVLVVIPLSVFVIYVSIPWVAASIGWFAPGGRWEMSPDPGGLMRWPVRILILPGFALLALQALSEGIKNFAFLCGAIATPQHEPIEKVIV
jgi:TRAP-type mannitol/chloroaromatic compound transport system permease small subunit